MSKFHSHLRALAALGLLLAAHAAAAADAPAVRIDARQITLLPVTTLAAYPAFTSTQDDAITGVQSPCCRSVELHTHEMDGEIMRMRKVDSVPLPAGQTVQFRSDGLHVMLLGLIRPLRSGEQVPLTFTFAHAPAQTVRFTAVAPKIPARRTP